MIEPTSGTVWLDDTDTASMPAHELRRQIGYVIQHAGLFPHRTIVDNIATVPFLLGTDKKQARATAMELLERVGLDPAFAQALSRAALGRPAAARRCRARVGCRPAGDADGRAVLGRRPGGPRPAPGGVPAPAGRARQDDRLRHPRHRRGDQARRPGGRTAGGRDPGPARRAPRAALTAGRRVRGRFRGTRPRLPRARVRPGASSPNPHDEPTLAMGDQVPDGRRSGSSSSSTPSGSPRAG